MPKAKCGMTWGCGGKATLDLRPKCGAGNRKKQPPAVKGRKKQPPAVWERTTCRIAVGFFIEVR